MRTSRMTTAQYAAQRCAHGGTTSAVSAGRRWMEGTTMDDLKALVENPQIAVNSDEIFETAYKAAQLSGMANPYEEAAAASTTSV